MIFSATLAVSWLLTYAVHSTVLLGLAWIASRTRRLSAAASEVVWKSAMLGSLLTSALQLSLDVRPAGTVALGERAPSVVTTRIPQAHRKPVGVHEEIADAPAPTIDVSSASAPHALPSKESTALFIWALVAFALGGTYAARRLILVGRLGARENVEDRRLLDMLEALSRDAGMKAPRLTATDRISSPVALGSGEICLPFCALADFDLEEHRSVLAHELAHIARRDPMWLALSSMVERVFWIQPLNRVARRQIATSAEFLCDEWAVRRTGSGFALASCLVQVAEWIQASPLGVPMAGMAEERSLLVTRISRLLENRMPTTAPRRLIVASAAAVLVGTVFMVPSVSGHPGPVAQENKSQALATPTDASPVHASLADAHTTDAMDVEHVGVPEHRVLTPADSTVVVALIARLKDEDAGVRAAAAQALGKLEDARAVPGLVDALKDTNTNVRSAAAEALGTFKDKRALNGLVSALADPSSDVKDHALEALSDYEDGVPAAPIIRLLEDSNAEIRHKAVHMLGQIHDRSAAPALAKMLKDSSPEVRSTAIEALGELHDASSASAILLALKDSNGEVRGNALNALDELKVGIPDAAMLALMKDQNAEVRAKAANLAGERSMVGMVPALVALLEDPKGEVRENAVQALGNIPDTAAHEGLRKALSSKDAKVRRAAVEALGERRP